MHSTPTLALITFLVAASFACGDSQPPASQPDDAPVRDSHVLHEGRDRLDDDSRPPDQWLERCDANGNGRVTCSEARADRCGPQLPVTDDHPLYQFMTDRDGDGLVCE